ncbi:16S rRNA (cytidine(1402)-2'-O)-methyltransferase [Patescibacteria group bacterium]
MLYIVATPIGNLKDITLRALEILKSADLILCEDTRVTRKLLDRYEIKNKKLESYHHHTTDKKVEGLIKIILEKNVALVTDAGTPGISDPGNKLINETLKHLNIKTQIISIPGPSAVITALSISGFPTDKFLFKGFIPHKKAREKFLKECLDSKITVCFYESPHRIIKCLNTLIEHRNQKQLVVCRELTKKFETIYRGTAQEVLEQIKKDFPNESPKGEFVVIMN